MRFNLQWLKSWQQDPLLGKVIRNTGYLFSSNTVSMGVGSLVGFLVPLLLSPSDYGALGMIITFASSINRLLSFRMGELVIKYGGQYLARGQKEEAAAVVKVAGLAEATTSLVAYGLLALLAPLAAQYIIKDPRTAPWIMFYGLSLLGNLVAETSTSVLQIGNHYRSQAVLNLVQSGLTAVLIVIAFLSRGDVFLVLTAYLVGKLAFGIGMAGAALRWMKPMFGAKWWRSSLRLLPQRQEMLKFAISTNLSGTINMVIRDSELLWVGYFLSTTQAGYYKFALAVMNVIMLPISPFITTTFPEISRLIAQEKWRDLRSLLQRTSLLALSWTAAFGVAFALLGRWFLGIFKQGEYLPAFGAILVLLVGYGAANILFWNRPLLLSLGKPNFPLIVTFVVGALKTGLMFVLVRPFGYLAQAALLSGYFVISVGVIVLRGWREVRRLERTPSQETAA
ncbi:MAG: oligosaccharide flippase family protein [Chloroflexi bacterium]|nr:oligosaccharide flippase family protein [Chloroflexota bacterium]